MIVKRHVTPDRRLVLAVCDDALLGKVIEEGNKQLDLSGSFYKGESMDRDAVQGLMKSAYIVNCVGKESVTCALETDLVDPKNVCTIDAVPYTQAVLLHGE